jgi:flagellar biosynthetic protein FliR
LYPSEVSSVYLLIALIKEIATGFFASVLLKITFDMLSFAGENISFAIGLSTAVAFDPASGTQSTAIGNFLKLSALIMLLSFDGHHMILLYMDEYIKAVPLGSLVINGSIVSHFMTIITNFFVVGFSMAFPIVILSLFMDVIFGMIMKTIPQFQVIVIGVPIKIGLGFIVIFAVLGSILFVWKREFMEAFESLQIFLIY